MLTHYKNIVPFITKDGSEIRELMHPAEPVSYTHLRAHET